MPLHEPATTSTSSWAAIAASLILVGLTVGGGLIVGSVRMAPSAVPPEMAVSASPAKRSLASNTHAQLQLSSSGPAWKELSRDQRTALSPLQNRWSNMGEAQKRRWLAVAENFEQLSEEEKDKLSSRMAAWSNLSVQQRNQARLNFSTRKKYAPGDLQAQWDAYQALSEAEKKSLAAKATPKARGAAPALRPPAKKKLASIPAAASVPSTVPNPPKIPVTEAVRAPLVRPALPTPATPVVVEAAPVLTPQAAPTMVLPPLSLDKDAPPPAPASPYAEPVHPPQ